MTLSSLTAGLSDRTSVWGTHTLPCSVLQYHPLFSPLVHTIFASAAAQGKLPNADEVRMTFEMIHHVLVAPVTHVSPANGGLPHPPVKFGKFAKIAQDKVGSDAKKTVLGLSVQQQGKVREKAN